MVMDDDYNESIENIIRSQGVNAEYAVAVTSDNFSQMFSAMEDEYMHARAADVRDISDRILKNLIGDCSSDDGAVSENSGKAIIAADDLTPGETVTLNKDKVLAFITAGGSANSHTAILARSMNIPAVISLGKDILKPEYDGAYAAVDGYDGTVYINPDEKTIALIKQKIADGDAKRALLAELKGKDDITLDGTPIQLYANIGGISDVGAVMLNDAAGIGLFRSELLYMESSDFPDEET